MVEVEREDYFSNIPLSITPVQWHFQIRNQVGIFKRIANPFDHQSETLQVDIFSLILHLAAHWLLATISNIYSNLGWVGAECSVPGSAEGVGSAEREGSLKGPSGVSRVRWGHQPIIL